MPQTMKAAVLHDYGGPEALIYADAPKPTPQAGEVLIRVHAAGVNPVDWKTRAGRGIAGMIHDPFPLILGWDVSGVIEELGAGVSDFTVGDAVYGMIRFPALGATYAEYALSPVEHLARKPATLDHVHAAALPLVALTAWQALFDAADLQAGRRVFIHAAAGGVGHIAVQLARWKGAFVIGTASAHNAAWLREFGLNEFIDYRTTPFEDVVRDVDVVLETVDAATRERSWRMLRRDGVLVSITGKPSAEVAAAYGVRAQGMFVQPNAAQLAEIARLADAGRIKPVLDHVFPLAEAAQAHARGETGHTRGKLVLQIVP